MGKLVRGIYFLLSHEIDTGKVIFQEKVAILEEMTAGDLHDLLMERGAELLVKTVDAVERNDYPLVEQSYLLGGREPKMAPKIFREDMKLIGLQMLKLYIIIYGDWLPIRQLGQNWSI